MEAAVDAIVVIDEGGRILSFSPAAELMFGYEASEVVDHSVDMLMPEPYRSNHAGYMRRYRQTGEARIIGSGREAEGLRSDGTVFPILLSVGEARWAFGRRYVGIIRDLTPQREAEMERHALEARLEHVGREREPGLVVDGVGNRDPARLGAFRAIAFARSRAYRFQTRAALPLTTFSRSRAGSPANILSTIARERGQLDTGCG